MTAIRPDVIDSADLDRDTLRSTAFDLWAWTCDQNCALVQRQLRSDTGIRVPEQTLRYWSKVDNWRVRMEQERMDVQPIHIRGVVALRLGSAAVNASVYLDRCLDGTIAPERTKVMAAKVALDAAGYSAIRSDRTDVTTTHVDPRLDPRKARTNYAELTLDELEAHEHRLRLPASTDPEPA